MNVNNYCLNKACPNNTQGIPYTNYYYYNCSDDNCSATGRAPVYSTNLANQGTISFDRTDLCQDSMKNYFCTFVMVRNRSCIINFSDFPVLGSGTAAATYQQTYCAGKTLNVNSANINDIKNRTNWINFFNSVDETAFENNQFSTFYGTYTCSSNGTLQAPASVATPTECGMPPADVIHLETTCTGSAKCAEPGNETIVSTTIGGRAYNFFCINERILKCPSNVTSYSSATGNSTCTDTALPPPLSNQCNDDGAVVTISGQKKVCVCSVFNNPSFDPFYCSTIGNTALNWGNSCSPVCRYRDVNEVAIQPVKINSPLALIKVIVNFLFWLAVAIFIINMLSAALEYVKGGDQPDKLKEASDRITGTIFGFVFLLVASGVINYIISRVTEFIP